MLISLLYLAMQLINVRRFINYILVKMIVECVWYHANALKCYKTTSKHNIYKRQYEMRAYSMCI